MYVCMYACIYVYGSDPSSTTITLKGQQTYSMIDVCVTDEYGVDPPSHPHLPLMDKQANSIISVCISEHNSEKDGYGYDGCQVHSIST